MLRLLFSVVFCLLTGVQYASAQYLFQRVYGGNGYDSGCEVIQASDDGYLVAGSSGSFDDEMSSQVLLLKTDTAGYEEWRYTYGEQYADQATSMQLSSDGYIFIGGYTETVDSSYQMLLMKLTMSGDLLWSKQYGGSDWEFCRQLVALPDGGCVLLGQTYSYGNGNGDFYLVRVNSDGDKLWAKTYGGSRLESGEAISLTTEGGFYLTGYTESYGAGKKDIYLVKTDASGDTIWTGAYGWAEDEYGYGSCTTYDGNVVVVGGTFSHSPGEGDFMMYKISSDGDSINALLQDGSTDEYWLDVIEEQSGSLVTVGYVEDSEFGKEDVRVARVTQDMWFDGLAASRGSAQNDRGFDIKRTSDDAYIIAGVTGGFLNKFDDVYLLKMGLNGGVVNPQLGVNEIDLGGRTFGVTIGPNPISDQSATLFVQNFDELKTRVRGQMQLQIFNAVGQLAEQETVMSGNQSLGQLDLQAGIYQYRLVSGDGILATGKLVKLN